jgi:UDP-arabinose 4-epimerase
MDRVGADSRNVLVTGGAGYIGAHTCKALAAAGFNPITIDNLSIGHRSFVKWGPFMQADIRDTATLCDASRFYNAVGVLHFAAFACVGESVTDPEKYYENNVLGTLSVLAAMRQAGLKKIVFSSSCAVYGAPEVTPISERTAPNPVNPYGRSKLMCEAILTDALRAYNFEPVILRYFNASGAEPESGLGENRPIETHLIPRAMMALLGRIDDFEVFGNDYPTPDGTAVRDYIHVTDLAEAHVLALRHLLVGGEFCILNLGVGKGYSVAEILGTISMISGRYVNVPTGARRLGDPAELVADATLARSILGFTPKWSDLRTIVDSAWRWHMVAHPMLTPVQAL